MVEPEQVSNQLEKEDHDSSNSSTAKTKVKTRARVRKRKLSESSDDVLPENTLEVEKNLCAAAIKNNLDETSVKKILKKVVTNDHVLALVQLREEEEDSTEEVNTVQRPKLTRAKVKELMKVSPKSAPWNLENLELTPIKHIPVKTRPEVKALIAQELPEDEDDDEYEPTNDDVVSDDEHTESCSDLDSQPRTPATPRSLPDTSPSVVKDGPFKVPQGLKSMARRRLQIEEEEATIALRTRSKLCLSETPIEHIESSFVPPDEVPLPVGDDLWNTFLAECLDPASTSKHEDDDEADPEYNVAADPDAHDEDEEALENTIIKISKKELNDLVTELFHIIPDDYSEKTLGDTTCQSIDQSIDQNSIYNFSGHWEGKKEPVSDEEVGEPRPQAIDKERRDSRRSLISIGKTEPMDIEDNECHNNQDHENDDVNMEQMNCEKNNSGDTTVRIQVKEQSTGVKPPEAPIPPCLRDKFQKERKQITIEVPTDDKVVILPEQIKILEQQLRQHIQLAASNFLQLFVNPEHWNFAPTYKLYLESLGNILAKNPNSVVNVCNLKPAIELIKSWEETVSVDTPENASMIDFVQKELDKIRRRASQNNLYIASFPEIFKQVVANSSVFLYPYLLPPAPYRGDAVRKNGYLHSEDSLLVLGLDQFWQYIEDNSDIYKPFKQRNPRSRWGFSIALDLTRRHMFPWVPFRNLACHIQHTKRTKDINNPLWKFFKKREIVPVQHKLLPFNPKLTLYQQPELEMPVTWLKYISKACPRARRVLRRNVIANGLTPNGLDVDLSSKIEKPPKKPLPSDFTKIIPSKNANVKPIAPKKELRVQITPLVYGVMNTPQSNAPVVQNTPNTSGSVFHLVQTNAGTYLMPIVQNGTATVNSTLAPITTPTIIANSTEKPEENSTDKSNKKYRYREKTVCPKPKTKDNIDHVGHCDCCRLLRSIVKVRQKTISECFKPNSTKLKCPCASVNLPTVSNKLRCLMRYYQTQFLNSWWEVTSAIEKLNERPDELLVDCHADDFAFAMSYQLRLMTRLSHMPRHAAKKRQLHALFSKFNAENSCPIWLANELRKIFNKELVDLHTDFVGFLTAEQADKIEMFKYYFVQNCVPDLVKKIDDEVTDRVDKKRILTIIREILTLEIKCSCAICYKILCVLTKYPKLAQYLFSLFPHRKKTLEREDHRTTSESSHVDDSMDHEGVTRDYEADHSSNDQDGLSDTEVEVNDTLIPAQTNEPKDNDIKKELVEEDTPKMHTVCKIEAQDSDQSELSLVVVEEENIVKNEVIPWRKDEDKIVLEVLKDCLSADDRKNMTNILEALEEMEAFETLYDTLKDRSKYEIKERVSYLLDLLALLDTD